jgi:DNA-binding beta-propeller fold protein YncE
MALTSRLATAAALVAVGVVPAFITGTASAAPGRSPGTEEAALARQEPAAGGTQLWASLYKGSQGSSQAAAVAVNPNGSQVFTAGTSAGARGTSAFVTVAYNAASGAKQWIRRYAGPGLGPLQAKALAVSPDGTKVFVTGEFGGVGGASGYQTVAYDAATGAMLWQQRFRIGRFHTGSGNAIAVSPDSSTVFVTGQTSLGTPGSLTFAYDATNGTQQWQSAGLGVRTEGIAIAVSPDGTMVFIATSRFGTVAYRAATGAKIWHRRYTHGLSASAVAVSPDGSQVFVTGSGVSCKVTPCYATVAYDAATGTVRWHRGFTDVGGGSPTSLAVSPDGSMVFVTGSTTGANSAQGYTTVAYDAATGAQAWVGRYAGPSGKSGATSVAVSPDGSTVFVTGKSQGRPISGVTYSRFATVAYDAATGARLWAARYGVRKGNSNAVSVAVSPSGSRVFVTGTSARRAGTYIATVAYSA